MENTPSNTYTHTLTHTYSIYTCLRPNTLAEPRKTVVAFTSSNSMFASIAPALASVFSFDFHYVHTYSHACCETCLFPSCIVTVIAATVREAWGIPRVHLMVTIIPSTALLMELCHYIPSCPRFFRSRIPSCLPCCRDNVCIA